MINNNILKLTQYGKGSVVFGGGQGAGRTAKLISWVERKLENDKSIGEGLIVVSNKNDLESAVLLIKNKVKKSVSRRMSAITAYEWLERQRVRLNIPGKLPPENIVKSIENLKASRSNAGTELVKECIERDYSTARELLVSEVLGSSDFCAQETDDIIAFDHLDRFDKVNQSLIKVFIERSKGIDLCITVDEAWYQKEGNGWRKTLEGIGLETLKSNHLKKSTLMNNSKVFIAKDMAEEIEFAVDVLNEYGGYAIISESDEYRDRLEIELAYNNLVCSRSDEAIMSSSPATRLYLLLLVWYRDGDDRTLQAVFNLINASYSLLRTKIKEVGIKGRVIMLIESEAVCLFKTGLDNEHLKILEMLETIVASSTLAALMSSIDKFVRQFGILRIDNKLDLIGDAMYRCDSFEELFQFFSVLSLTNSCSTAPVGVSIYDARSYGAYKGERFLLSNALDSPIMYEKVMEGLSSRKRIETITTRIGEDI